MSSPENLNTIIFTIARMNPPTPGHLSLITYLIKEAVRLNVPKVFLILSKTNNSNPKASILLQTFTLFKNQVYFG